MENITAAVRRARITEDRIVPEGWRVEWVPFLCGWCTTGHDLGTFPRLVPDTPHEEGEQP